MSTAFFTAPPVLEHSTGSLHSSGTIRWFDGALRFLAGHAASQRVTAHHRVARGPVQECPRDRALLYLYPGICD